MGVTTCACDFQLDLTMAQLTATIGAASADALIQQSRAAAPAHGGDGDMRAIRLRRVVAASCGGRGECIPFHVDTSHRTMQVALNDEASYTGGRLAFVTAAGVECPLRPAGSAMAHGRGIVHG